jgi:drug/metabolite transporter (DMT)-like permease
MGYLGWAMAAVIAKRMLISVEPIPLLFFRLAITSFVLLPVFYINGYYTVIFQLTTTEIILISFIAIFSLCISFSLFYHGLKLIKVGLASVLELVTPVVGIMFSFLILKESYNLIQVISCIVILISTYKLATLKD